MTIKFLGQNCFLFNYQGVNILTDPFYNFQKDTSGFDISAQKIDYLLITHAHQDHTADVQEVLKRHPDVVIIGQPEVCSYYKHDNAIDLNYGGTAVIEDLKISMLSALHTSSFPDGTYGGNPCGYMLQFPDKNLYFAGDTGVTADMELFPRLFGEISMAILPIGGHYTMCPRQAAFAAAELLRVNKVLGCHFDTFAPITIDHEVATKIFADKRVELILPEVGEDYNF